MIHIANGAVVLPAVIRAADILIDGRTIVSVGKSRLGRDAVSIDASGHYVAPGFIDSHIHGDPKTILKNEVRHGTTAIVVTESCAPLSRIADRASRLKAVRTNHPLGMSVLGFRMEGPYISPEKAGAQDKRYIRAPRSDELARIIRRSQGLLTMMTIAPERTGATRLIRLLANHGVIASIGHSNATYEEARRGFACGINHATHIFNAMRKEDIGKPGVVGAVLASRRVTAEVILDLVHAPKELFARLVMMKGVDKIVLVTDSIRALRQKGATKARGAYRFANGALAGSGLTMIEAVRNAVMECGLKLPDAVRMASLNPALMLGLERSRGTIGPGKDADIVIFDKDFNVKMTVVRGKIAYRKGGF